MANIVDTIKNEIDTDPLTLGYSGMTDLQVLASLTGLTRSRNRTSMSGKEVGKEIVDAAYDVLTDAQKNQVLTLVASEDLDPFSLGANVIKNVFGTGSATVTALAVARVESISRITEIGVRGKVGLGVIQEARK